MFWMREVKACQGISSRHWRLVYADPHDDTGHTFYASRLLVDGQPMRCRPDVVLRNTATGLVIVVERKVTGWQDSDVPEDAWPNVRAQLWCYGWIDDWLAAPDVILVCQFHRRRLHGRRQDRQAPWIWNWEKRPGWRRSDAAFHSECLGYFIEYGGSFLDAS